MSNLEFPRWRYHQDCPEGKIIQTYEEFLALGEGWVDSPAKLVQAEPSEPVVPACKFIPPEEEKPVEEVPDIILEEKPKPKLKKKGK